MSLHRRLQHVLETTKVRQEVNDEVKMRVADALYRSRITEVLSLVKSYITEGISPSEVIDQLRERCDRSGDENSIVWTFRDIMKLIYLISPGATVDNDSEGQIVIHTNLVDSDDVDGLLETMK